MKIADIEGAKDGVKIRGPFWMKGAFIKFKVPFWFRQDGSIYGDGLTGDDWCLFTEQEEPHLLDNCEWFDSEIMEFHELKFYRYGDTPEFDSIGYTKECTKGFNVYVYKLRNDRLTIVCKIYGFEWNNNLYPHYVRGDYERCETGCTPSNLIGVVMMKKEWSNGDKMGVEVTE